MKIIEDNYPNQETQIINSQNIKTQTKPNKSLIQMSWPQPNYSYSCRVFIFHNWKACIYSWKRNWEFENTICTKKI